MENNFVEGTVSDFIDFMRGYSKGFPLSKVLEDFKKSKEPKKDYKILSFNHKNELYELSNNGSYVRRNFINPASLNHVLKGVEIISVKRLRDGEIFTVDEKLESGTTIKRFNEIISQGEKSLYVDMGNFGTNIQSLTKIKQPKDYEVLTYQHIVLSNELGKNIIIDKTSIHFEYAHGCPNDFKIHSVRRLSDGEVFAVGDKVRYTGELCHYDNFVIDNFFLNKNKCLARDNENGICEWITEIKKVKEPLFTTEDGKEIYEGDKYWHVSITYDIAPCKADKDVKYNLFESRTFSTKKAAEEYIIINKPCLSITDVGSVLSGNLSLRVAAELKELVKSKL